MGQLLRRLPVRTEKKHGIKMYKAGKWQGNTKGQTPDKMRNNSRNGTSKIRMQPKEDQENLKMRAKRKGEHQEGKWKFSTKEKQRNQHRHQRMDNKELKSRKDADKVG